MLLGGLVQIPGLRTHAPICPAATPSCQLHTEVWSIGSTHSLELLALQTRIDRKMAAYSGSIGSVNVLEIVSTDLFDESQENPFLLQHQRGTGSGYTIPASTIKAPVSSPLPSPDVKRQSVRFVDLPLADPNDTRGSIASPVKATNWSPRSSPVKRLSVLPPPVVVSTQASPSSLPVSPHASVSFSPPGSPTGERPSITIQFPFPRLQRHGSTDSNASTMASQSDHDAFLTAEEAELHKLLCSLARLGLAQAPPPTMQVPPAGQPQVLQSQQQSMYPHTTHVPLQSSFASTSSAPTSPHPVATSCEWLPPPSHSAQWQPQAQPTTDNAYQLTGTAGLMFRALPGRQSSRRGSKRQSKAKRFASAPNSPQHQHVDSFFSEEEEEEEGPSSHREANYSYGSQSSSPQPHNSRGSVTFLTVKNLLRGGGALARTVRHDQPIRRPTCYGTVSSRLKRRQKFQRPTVITDAYHRVSDMKLGTSPMKVKIKHLAFPQTWATDEDHSTHDIDPDMPSPKGQLRRESLITLETLDKIGTRHACPVQLIEEPLPDFSNIQPRVDAWNNYKKPKKDLRRPSAWLLGATATSTPHGLND